MLKFLLQSQMKQCNHLLRISKKEKYKLVNHCVIIMFHLFQTLISSAGYNTGLVASSSQRYFDVEWKSLVIFQK